ncbi:putative glycosyltransferase EpsJ [Lacticaseibacillus paracasei]|uniref:glycosyltransferase family 2 protein n=1 Tax=Lacticaseibacillus paracasei TaxID=1597 RepID=UPI000FEF41DF|nr:glycosyltransferase family 2 protein [Lacticaseibacillus paracasei]RND62454.1 putative glycosyltransferase EpsJ [Lacticaseibacillus paracasei]
MVKVSVIIPAYNSAETLERAVYSVLNQTMADFEVLIVNNGSHDNTANVIMGLVKRDGRVRSLESMKGRSRARNKGLKEANGTYIQFLDADDELSSEKLADGTAYLQAHPDVDAYITSVLYRDDQKQAEQSQQILLKSSGELLKANYLPISAPIVRNIELASFNEDIEYNEDWLFWAESLYDKKVVVRQSIGSIIHITSKNTMAQIDTMQIYECYVRGILKEEFAASGVKYWQRDIKLSLGYLLSANDKTIKTLRISKTMEWPIGWARIILAIPPLKWLIVKKWRSVRGRSMYG